MEIKYIFLRRNKIIVGKCKVEIDNNIAWLENVIKYKKFRGLGYLMKRMKIETINLHVKYDILLRLKFIKILDLKL